MIAPTIVMMTLAIAEMMALMPRPIAEKIEPYKYRPLEKKRFGSCQY